jgi:tetratricopeptide (TPR) repeat protein
MKKAIHISVCLLLIPFCYSQLKQRTNAILDWVETNQAATWDRVLDSLNVGLELARKSEDVQLEVNVLLGLSQFTVRRLDNVEKATEYLEQIKYIGTLRANDPWVLSRYHNGKGVLYYYTGAEKNRAFQEFKRSNLLIKNAGLKEDPRLLNNYALAFLSENDARQALEIFKLCRRLEEKDPLRKKPSNHFLLTNASNTGICYIYLGKIDSAEMSFKQAVSISELTPGNSDNFDALVYLGVFYEEQGNNELALQTLKNAESIIDQALSWERKELLCEALKNVYRRLGDFNKALIYSDLSQVFEDSLRNKKLSEQAFALDYKLELDRVRSEQRIQRLETSVSDQRSFFRITLLSLLLVVVIAISTFIFYRLHKQKELNRIKAENEYLEKERIRQQAEIDLLIKEEELIFANVELNFQKNELSELKNRLQSHLDKSYDPEFDDLKQFLKQAQKTEKKADQLKYLDHVLSYSNSAFYKRLKELHKNLTEDEMRLATLIRLNLSSDELVLVFNISMNSLMTKRYRLRKKLELAGEDSLENYIMSL